MTNSEVELVERALPSYQIGGELGRGAAGVVYSGVHRQLGRKVAVKQLARAFATDPDVAGRFLREAQMAASLDHPHIVPVYDYIERDGLALIVMERCASALRDGLGSESVPLDRAAYAGLATLSALGYAHARGVLHRDIKPDNLLLDGNGVVKLADFGIARALDEATRLTATGTVIGTPIYMSPEQAGGTDVGPASDLYSVGVVLYQLLSGRLPYRDASSIQAIIRQHLTEAPAPLSTAVPGIPPAVAHVIDRALAKDPAARWQDATAFGVALGEATSLTLGPGWPRRKGFALQGAPEIVAATERTVASRATDTHRAPPGTLPGPFPVPGHGPPVAANPAPTPAGAPGAGLPPQPGPSQPGAAPDPFAARRPGGPTQTWQGETTTTTPDRRLSRALLLGVVALLVAASAGVAAFTFLGEDGGDDGGDETADTGDEATTSPTTTPPSTEGAGGGEESGSADPAVVDPPAGAPLTVGLLIDGSGAFTDEDQQAAAQLAVEDINAAGGVLGQPVTLLAGQYDGALSLAELADAHIDGGATAIIGPSNPFDTDTALQPVTSRDALLVSPSDGSYRSDRPELLVRLQVSKELLAAAVAFNATLDGDRVVYVTNSRPQESVVDAMRTIVEDEGASLTVVPTTVDDLDAAVAEIIAADPSAIVLERFGDLDAVYQAVIAAGIGPADVPYYVLGGTGAISGLPDGSLTGVEGWMIDPTTGEALEERLLATTMSPEAAQAYDALIALALAAQRADDTSAEALLAALPEVTGEGEVCVGFADCAELIDANVDIDFVGLGGPYDLSAETGQPRTGWFQVSTLDEAGQIADATRVLFGVL